MGGGGGGVVLGFLGGGAVGVVTGLPGEKAVLVTEVTAVPQLGLDLATEMKSRVTADAPTGLVVLDGDAPATVVLRLDEASLNQHFAKDLSLTLEASLTH